ncbi:MAG: polymerase IV protein [Parcubacteria group bacterium GW2011_GWF2_40_69]|nr:MAG: polymerase IV protein [Parcubacteria group bacterium GW2011_GWC1_39_12]KKR34876.1 MAG: polymerase IV protein [Parcubacteria group bacterium GW2011_GWC2_40_10]KKR66118.1 MAG: polymerase IV protein [Parcubacteria group bacterium GW2011_GWB1_40_5]KKR68645.1 MAG: polymerase IV protein [Parcubacteria group bacterium GW2011_GWF2_40_69]KKR81133.1 MAG: polymerase IV protein [Parcubacteria group bacterium GW2011_GWD1_40_9]KKS35683.1 MAG: polymerase IV protein [Parcubacteria group bacterium GW20
MRSEPRFTYNMVMQRIIFHMDGDAFFVGCEVAKNPGLRGLPVVTGEERGIVSALSYEAKTLGIKRGMPIFRVKKDFPCVLVLPGDYASYTRFSQMMFDIVRRYADDVEEYSIDECFADLTGLDRTLKMSYLEIAERIKREVTVELGLSVSVGLAPTKVLAKVASNWVKPNGLTVIDPEKTAGFLLKTPIEKVWGIGPRTAEYLKKKNIQTAGDFAEKDVSWVRNNLSQPYESMWLELNSVCVSQVDSEPKTVYSSIQKTRTFHPPTRDTTFLLSEFSKNIEDACRKARHYKLVSKKISFFLKSRDFKYFTLKIVLDSPTNAPEVLVHEVRLRLGEMYKPGVIYRTTGVTLSDLVPDTVQQGDLFGSGIKAGKFESIHRQLDLLEEKFNKRVVYLGSTHKALNKKKLGTDSEDLDRDLLFL